MAAVDRRLGYEIVNLGLHEFIDSFLLRWDVPSDLARAKKWLRAQILQPWQRDIIGMIHEEMEYFVPQMQTKTMNEGLQQRWL